MVSGKPMAIRLSCGAARLRIASARLLIIKATMIGRTRKSPAEKTIAAELARLDQVVAPSLGPPMGITEKLCVRVAITIRWPLMAMNTSRASRPMNSETTAV
jgi:hypothetical protein